MNYLGYTEIKIEEAMKHSFNDKLNANIDGCSRIIYVNDIAKFGAVLEIGFRRKISIIQT